MIYGFSLAKDKCNIYCINQGKPNTLYKLHDILIQARLQSKSGKEMNSNIARLDRWWEVVFIGVSSSIYC